MEAQLYQAYQKYDRSTTVVAVATISATVLVGVALTVIACSSLCFTLPGVNAMRDVVRPYIIPSIEALIVSIPLIVTAVRCSREKKREEKVLASALKPIAIQSIHPLAQKRKNTHRLIKALFRPDFGLEYKISRLNDLKSTLPKERDKCSLIEQALLDSIDEAVKLCRK